MMLLYLIFTVVMLTYLSRMNRMRSLANKPRLDRQENPNSAKVKKKIPITSLNQDVSRETNVECPCRDGSGTQQCRSCDTSNQQQILCAAAHSRHSRNVMEKEAAY